jgi:hypothetical protein
MHPFFFMLWNGNLVPLCQHSHEKAPNYPKEVFKDNYEAPLALFDIHHASRRNQCSDDRKIFQLNKLK